MNASEARAITEKALAKRVQVDCSVLTRQITEAAAYGHMSVTILNADQDLHDIDEATKWLKARGFRAEIIQDTAPGGTITVDLRISWADE